MVATVYEPDTPREPARPGMLVMHGGAWMFGSRYQQAWFCRSFARAGYVVMTFEYRLMPRFAFPYCVDDCRAAHAWFVRNAGRFGVDTARIAAFGASAGGHLAAMLAARPCTNGTLEPADTAVKAAVVLYGPTATEQFLEEPRPGLRGILIKRYFKSFGGRHFGETLASQYSAVSVIPWIKNGCRPMLLVHGTWDHIVPFAQSKRLFDALTRVGAKTQLVPVKNGFHGFDYVYVRERRRVFAAMVQFLREQGLAP
ncbi:MAG: hypothetical protein AMXMBFR84_22880 [Candidatus Hydrogenedentota bacterium]